MEKVNANVKRAATKVEQIYAQPLWSRDLVFIIGAAAFIVAYLLAALFNF